MIRIVQIGADLGFYQALEAIRWCHRILQISPSCIHRRYANHTGDCLWILYLSGVYQGGRSGEELQGLVRIQTGPCQAHVASSHCPLVAPYHSETMQPGAPRNLFIECAPNRCHTEVSTFTILRGYDTATLFSIRHCPVACAVYRLMTLCTAFVPAERKSYSRASEVSGQSCTCTLRR